MAKTQTLNKNVLLTVYIYTMMEHVLPEESKNPNFVSQLPQVD